MQRVKLSQASIYVFSVAALVACVGQMATAASFTWDGQGGDNNWRTGANWVGGVNPPPGSILVFDGSARPSTINNYNPNTSFSGIVFNSTASAAFTLSSAAINLNGNITDNEQAFVDTIALNLGLQTAPTISVTSFGSLTISGIVSGGFGLNETGGGLLNLTNTNTFTGPVTVGNGATLGILADGNLGAVPSSTTSGDLVLDGGATLFDSNPLTTATGTGATAVNLTLNSKRGITILNAGGATPSFATINVPGLIANTQGGVNVRQTITYDGVIADSGTVGGLTKLGFGTLVLGGQNTYTGATTVGNGTLSLDFTQTGAPTSNIINSSSALTLGGSTAGLGDTSYAQLLLTGAATADSQTFSSTNIAIGPANIRVTSGAGGTNLALGTLTHTTGGVVNFVPPTTGTGAISVNTGTTSNTNGILGGWATVGTGAVQNQVFQATDWATLNGSGQVVAYTGYTTYGSGGNLAAGTQLKGNVTAATNLQKIDTSADVIPVSSGSGDIVDVNTIAFKNSAAADTIVVGANNTLRFGKYGGVMKQDGGTDPASLFIGGATGSVGQTGNGTAGSQGIGTITAGGPTAGPGEIVFTLSSSSETTGTLIVEPTITDNPLGGAVTVIKAGVGSMKLDGHNTFSGGLYIEAGRLQFAGSEINSTSPNPDGGGTGPIFVFPGAQLFPSGAASAASPQTITNPISLAGIGLNSDGTGSIRMGQGLTIGTPTSKINLIGNDRIAGGGAAFVDPTTAALHPGSLLAGQITGNFNMDFGASGNTGGSGTTIWINNPLNNWTGNTTILGRVGTAQNSILHTAANNVIPNGVINVGGVPFVTGNVIMGVVGDASSGETITLDLDGTNQTINGLVSGITAANVTNVSQFIENDLYWYPVGQNGNTQPAPAGMPTAANQSTLTLGNNNQTATFSGVIRDSASPANVTGTVGGNAYTYVATGNTMALTKIGTGIQTLSGVNTYSGPTNINAGALSITANGTTPGSLLSTGTVNVNTSATSAGALYGGVGTVQASVGNVVLAASNNGNNAVINPGATGPGSTGILAMTSLTANSGSSLQFDLQGTTAGTSYDQINVGGTASFSGPTTIVASATLTNISCTVLTATSLTGTVPTLVSSGDTRLTYSYDAASWNGVTGNSIIVDVSGTAANLTWSGNVPSRPSDGITWDLHTTPNWTSNPTPSVGDPNEFYQGDNVTFNDTGTPTSPNSIAISVNGTLNPGSMTFSNQNISYTIGGGGSIGGGGAMVINGGGTVTLATSNTFTGGVTLSNNSTLNINNNALGTGTFTINSGTLGNTSGGTVVLSANPTQVWNTDITFNGPNDLNLGTGAVTSTTPGASPTARVFNITAGTLTVGGTITETNTTTTVGITKNGNGTLALAANSTFTGPTSINAGTLSVGTSASLGGAVVINATPTTGANQIVLPSTTGLSVGIGISGAGIPAGTTITAIDVPSNTITISNNATASVAANLTFATNTSLITVANGAALDVGGSTTANSIVIGPRAVTISGTGVGGTGVLTNSSTTAQQNAFQNVTLAADSTIGGTGRIDIRGSAPVIPAMTLGGHTLTKTGTNQFSLVGATVDAGNIVVNQGTLSIETGTSIANNNDGTSITYNDGTTAGFYENAPNPGNGNASFVQRPIVINGNVTINDESPAAFLTSIVGSNIALHGNVTYNGGNTSTMTFTGTMTEDGTPRSVTKTGPSTTIMTTTANSYSGPTNLNGGLLQFAALGTLGSGTQLNFAGGGLQYAPNMASPPDLSVRTMTFNAGGATIDTNGNNVSFANSIGNGGAGGFTKAGNGTLTLNSASTYTGNTTVANGTLVLGAAGAFPANTAVIMGSSVTVGTVTTTTDGILDLASQSITVTGLTTAGGTGSQIGSSSTTQNVTLTFASPNNTPNVYNGSIVDGVNGGSKMTALTVSSGTLVLNNGGNSYSGATTINPGATLQLGNNTSANPSLNSASAITDNGSLVFGGNSLNLNNSITGSGSVTQASGTTTLGAANSYMGGTTLQGGVLQINSDAGINNGVGGIQFSGGVLQFGGYTSNLSFNSGNTTGNVSLASSGTSTLNGSINTTGNFTYSGFGTLTLAGTVNYTGATNITQSGTLILGAAASLPNNTSLTIGDPVSGNPTLDVNGHNITVSSLTSPGTSSPTITNNSTTTNATITLNGGATANTFNGSIQNGSNNKTLALTINSGSLTLTNSGNNYSGNTTIGPGATLSLTSGNALQNTAHLTLNGGTFATGGQGQDMHTTKLAVGASSVIDLGAGSGTLQLADSTDQAWNASAYLRINNWSGNLTGAGTDQITFTGSGLLPAQLNKVHFTGYVTGSQLIAGGELVPLTALKIGDVNQDGVVSVADISALMTALSDPTTYLTNHPALVDSLTVTDLLDVNGDGKDTSTDIQALISKIATNGGNPSLSAVPEPTSLVLLAIGGVCALAVRKFKSISSAAA